MRPGTTIVALLTLMLLCHQKAFSQSASGVVNSYYAITTVNAPTNSVIVDNSTGLEPGELVLIIQTKGATIDATNTATYGNVTAINTVGDYEFNIVCNVIGNQVWLISQMLHAYNPAGQVQMVAVPSYQSVTVSGTITGSPWDPVGGKGGIVAIAATDTIFLNADIDVSGQGFIGGGLVNYPTPSYNCAFNDNVNQYFLPFPASGNVTAGTKGEGITALIVNEEYARGKLANGGGGGNNANTGGGGGGQYGTGGDGGKRAGESAFNCHGPYPGLGGASLATFGYSAANNRIFLGGGGGGGHENNAVGEPGGNGGGIIILSAPVIIGGGGRLLANGLAPLNPVNTDPAQAEGDGGGGGGAGGVIVLNVPVITGAVSANANGATGSNSSNFVNDCTGPGGGGAGGVVWTAGATVPVAVTASVSGGANGVVSAGNTKAVCKGLSNGATAGGAGISQPGYIAPLATGSVCVVLASSLLKDFNGVLTDQGSLLSWDLYVSGQSSGISSFTIEYSSDQVHFTALTTVEVSAGLTNYHYTDPAPFTGTVFYRLIWTDQQGNASYSSLIALTRPEDPLTFVRLYPNPVIDRLFIDLFSRSNEPGMIRIFNAQGQQLMAYPFNLSIGTTSLTLPVAKLAAGTYFLIAETKSHRQVKAFIRKS
jgi:Secretion system C-terminal sorting domain